MSTSYLNAIDEVQEAVFQYDTVTMDKKVITMIDELSKHPRVLANEDAVQEDLQELFKAYRVKDYLRMTDVLEFRLKPLLVKKRREQI